MSDDLKIQQDRLIQEMQAVHDAIEKFSVALERRKQRRAAAKVEKSALMNQVDVGNSPSIPDPNVGTKQWRTETVSTENRESTIFKLRAQGWAFFGGTDMPMSKVDLKFYKVVDSKQMDGIGKSTFSDIRKLVQTDNPNASPLMIQRKTDEAVGVYKATGVLPKTSAQQQMGVAKTVEVSATQRDATIASYQKLNWRYVSETRNNDTKITRLVFEKM